MSINSVMNNQSNEMLIQNLGKMAGRAGDQEMKAIYTSSFDSVSLSFVGKSFGEYYETLRASGDQQALEGLRQTAIHFARNPDSNQAVNFSNTMNAMADNNDFMVNFFQAVDEVVDGNHNLGNWVNTFMRMESADNQQSFVDVSRSIMSLDASADDVGALFNNFMGAARQVADSVSDSELRAAALTDYFQQLDKLDNVGAYQQAIDTVIDGLG